MSLFGNISGKDAVRAFQKQGWQIRGQVGSHVVLTKTGATANLSIPQHKNLGPGLLRSLIRNAGISVEQFIKLVR